MKECNLYEAYTRVICDNASVICNPNQLVHDSKPASFQLIPMNLLNKDMTK